MMSSRFFKIVIVVLILGVTGGVAESTLKTEPFDKDPGWEGFQNQLDTTNKPKKRGLAVKQSFGYGATNFAGKEAGEMGGVIQRSLTRAYYADAVSPKTLDDKLGASGSFAITATSGSSGVFFGWFNSDEGGSAHENTLGFHLAGQGAGARLTLRLVTGDNQACGTKVTEWIKGKNVVRSTPPSIKNDGTRYTFTQSYDPNAAGGNGQMRFTIKSNSDKPDPTFEGKTFTVDLPKGYKQQHTTFDRFGVANSLKGGNPMTIYFDDLEYDGKKQDFSKDPGWASSGNQASFEDREQGGMHDFGFSPDTHFAGGTPGEIGGLMWRSGSYAYYADRVGPLSLNDRLEASGKVMLKSSSQDCGMYFGWFNSADKDNSPVQAGNFLGVKVGGPTHVGHYFVPAYATAKETPIARRGVENHPLNVAIERRQGPIIEPGKIYDWKLLYDPDANDGKGQIQVTLGGESVSLPLREGDKAKGADFDRFGLFTNHIGGSFVKIYFDDLTYTATRAEK
jgi:hypothetical protein